MSRLRTAVAAATATVAFLAMALPAQARDIVLHPGDSIQAAVDGAKAGDTVALTPGTFHGNVTITKPNVDIRGAGIGVTTLVPGAAPAPSPCSSGVSDANGICVLGRPDAPVKGVDVSGLTINGFGGYGVLLLMARDVHVRHTEAASNGGYGISGFVLNHVEFSDDVSHDNGAPGFYIGDSPDADAKVMDNLSYRNGAGLEEGDGFLFRDSTHGDVRRNVAFGNCLGFNVVDSPENPAPAEQWTLRDNFSSGNSRACRGEQGGGPPPLSGIGFAILGAHDVKLEHNIALGNFPTGFSAIPSAGITVVSTAMIGGSAPQNVRVEKNSAFGNTPVDVLYDGSGTNVTFKNNSCGTSAPPGLCS